MTYSCEAWTLKTDITNKVQVVQTSMARTILRMTGRHRKRVAWITQETQVLDVIEKIKSLKWQWAGHIARTDNMDHNNNDMVFTRYEETKKTSKPKNFKWNHEIRRQEGTT